MNSLKRRVIPTGSSLDSSSHTHRTPATLTLSPDHCNLLFKFILSLLEHCEPLQPLSKGDLMIVGAMVRIMSGYPPWCSGSRDCDPSSLSTCTHGDWDHCCDPVLFDKSKAFRALGIFL